MPSFLASKEDSLLVRKPTEELFKYKGYSVIVQSDNPTEDGKRFDADVLELRMLITSALQDRLKL